MPRFRTPRLSILKLFSLAAFTGMSAVAQTLPPRLPSQFIRNLEAGKPQTLVAFGTSLTAGGAWVGLVDGWLKSRYPGLAKVHNEGASGHSSEYALTIVGNVTRRKPDAVLIEFAMNDAYYPEQNGFKEGVPVDSSAINLGRLIDSIRAVSPACEIIPQTMDIAIGKSGRLRPNLMAYYQGYRNFSKSRGLALADHEPLWKAVLDFDTALYVSWVPDSLHPNPEGSAAITFPEVLATLTGAGIEMAAPAPQAVFREGDDILFKTTVTRPIGAVPVTRVDFYRGKQKLGTDSIAPYEFSWKGAQAGKYLILARLIQKENPVAISRPMRIKVETLSALQPRPATRDSRMSGAAKAIDPSFWLGRNPN